MDCAFPLSRFLMVGKQLTSRSMITEASTWRKKHGTLYNETVLRLVYNTFNARLYPLATSVLREDVSDVRRLLSADLCFKDPTILEHCEEILDSSVLLLWRFGVFHSDDCRRTLLRNLPSDRKLTKKEKKEKYKQDFLETVEVEQEVLLARIMKEQRVALAAEGRQSVEQRKEAKRLKKKAKNLRSRLQRARKYHDVGQEIKRESTENRGKIARLVHVEEASLDGTGSGRHSKASHHADSDEDLPNIRGGRQHTAPTFNPSTLNDHAAGDQDTTLLDVSPLKQSPHVDKQNFKHVAVPVEDDAPKCYGLDMFRASNKRENTNMQPRSQKHNGPNVPAAAAANQTPQLERSLQDVYTDHRDLKLTSLEADGTLQLAGQIAKTIVRETTLAFLQKCIPAAERNDVWKQVIMMTGADLSPTDVKIKPVITIPSDILNRQNGVRAAPQELLGTCISAMQASFDTHDTSTLAAVFNRCISLCDALDDTKRAAALDATLKALQWLIVGLSVKETQLYRAMNAVLVAEYDRRYPLAWSKGNRGGKQVVVVSPERWHKERALLARHRKTFEEFKTPFRRGFVECLQTLMDVKDE